MALPKHLLIALGCMLSQSILAASSSTLLEPVRTQLRLKNFAQAAKLLQPIAASGNADAEVLLANLYRNGLGVGEDTQVARQWLTRAAEQGNANAMYELAALLAEAEAPDHALIRQWLERAAKAGQTLALQAVQNQIDPRRFQPEKTLQDNATRRAAFWLAAAHNDVEQLQVFNDAELLTAADEFGRTALSHAARNGATQAVAWLLQAGADINHTDSFGITPLMLAAGKGQLEVVNQLIKAGADSNAQDKTGNTALMHAIGKQQQNCVDLLLTTTHLNLRNAQSWSALDWALHDDNAALAARLRSLGLESSHKALVAVNKPAIPLQHASSNDLYRGWPDVLIASTRSGTDLFDALVQTNSVALRGNETAALLTAVQADNAALIDKLLARGVSISTDAAETPLSWAVRHGKLSTVQQLLARGIKPDLHGKNELAPLLEVPHLDTSLALPMLDVLLKTGASTDSRDRLGRTALMLSAPTQAALVELLLHSGANDALADNSGRTALMVAAMNGSDDVMRLLVNNRATLDRRDSDGNSALMLAAAAGNANAVAQLIAAGASTQSNKSGATALMLAAASGQEAMVKKLLSAGLKVDAQNQQGDTALMFAARAGQLNTLRALLAAGADADLRDNDRASAKDIAERLAFREVAAALAQRG